MDLPDLSLAINVFMNRSHWFPVLLLLPGGALAAQEKVSFEKEIVSLIAKRCVECHNARDMKGGLDLSSRKAAFHGGESGKVLEPGNVSASSLIDRLVAGEMPPESRGQSQKLPAAEIALLSRWVAEGAQWPADRRIDIYEKTTDVRGGLDWWSLQPVKRPAVPSVRRADRVVNPIDSLVLSRLEASKMEPAPPADRRTLVRRAYFDLLGLPPTSEQVAAFLQDKNLDAYEKLIDQLLASKHYGERWARYWLDLVRFAETCGYERDQLKPNIWRYRDWVIDAFNNDMPYDRFVTDQLAGDEVPYRDQQSVIATGMIRAGTWNDEPNDPADYLYTRLEDMVHTTTSAFIGLTVKCARCHDHKFDPIRQTDYYRTASIFWSGYMGDARGNLGGPSKEQLGMDVFGWTDRGRTSQPIRLLIKGEREKPGPVVAPATLSTIPALETRLKEPPAASKTTQRRLQFARWMTRPDHPLTARVMVNRLWQYHFGQGIVRTPNNFGFKSAPPTHPLLLDWLAAEFVEGGWKIKRMHKLIMMSATYRQSSQHPAHQQYEQQDFLNERWWRFNRRRLDAEALRDAMLTVSGRLNPRMGGPSFYPRMSPEALEGLSRKSSAWGTSTQLERSRRSIYMMTKRSRLLPLMTTFDFTDTTLPCGQRDVTTVPTQSLALLNNHFVHEQSLAMAGRILQQADGDLTRSVEQAWLLALGRLPRADEKQAGIAHVESQLASFEEKFDKLAVTAGKLENLDVRGKLALWLRADEGVQLDKDQGVMFWKDGAGSTVDGLHPHDGSQFNPVKRPRLIPRAIQGKAAIRFDGKDDFLHLAGTPLWSQEFSLFVVASDRGAKVGHRELISNWHRRGRSTSSWFMGLTGKSKIRLSDVFVPAGEIVDPTVPFILSGFNSKAGAETYQGRTLLASASQLKTRDMAGPYVVGVQGNYGTEYWDGDIAEIILFERSLTRQERESVWQYLANRYGIKLVAQPEDPRRLALASLCHVLINTNEFLYID